VNMKTNSTVQKIRTFVPAIAGVIVARILGAILTAVPAVADVIRWVDGVLVEAQILGVSTLEVIKAVLIALVILGYQSIAQWLGDRWPRIEALMLGSASRPDYLARHSS